MNTTIKEKLLSELDEYERLADAFNKKWDKDTVNGIIASAQSRRKKNVEEKEKFFRKVYDYFKNNLYIDTNELIGDAEQFKDRMLFGGDKYPEIMPFLSLDLNTGSPALADYFTKDEAKTIAAFALDYDFLAVNSSKDFISRERPLITLIFACFCMCDMTVSGFYKNNEFPGELLSEEVRNSFFDMTEKHKYVFFDLQGLYDGKSFSFDVGINEGKYDFTDNIGKDHTLLILSPEAIRLLREEAQEGEYESAVDLAYDFMKRNRMIITSEFIDFAGIYKTKK